MRLQRRCSRFQIWWRNSQKQQVFILICKKLKGIKFGTPAPLNYFDNFYNAELFLRAHGNYSIKITDPLLSYILMRFLKIKRK